MIFCVGDSHVSLFCGKPSCVVPLADRQHNEDVLIFKTLRIGPCTAYNLYKKEKLIFDALRIFGFNKEKDQVLLCTGEIDCRVHIPNNICLECQDCRAIENTVNNLFLTVKLLNNNGITCMTFSPSASTWLNPLEYDAIPVTGSEIFRNKISIVFDEYLKSESERQNIKHFSILKDLINDDLTTKRQFYIDFIHLDSYKCKDFIQKEFNI